QTLDQCEAARQRWSAECQRRAAVVLHREGELHGAAVLRRAAAVGKVARARRAVAVRDAETVAQNGNLGRRWWRIDCSVDPEVERVLVAVVVADADLAALVSGRAGIEPTSTGVLPYTTLFRSQTLDQCEAARQRWSAECQRRAAVVLHRE